MQKAPDTSGEIRRPGLKQLTLQVISAHIYGEPFAVRTPFENEKAQTTPRLCRCIFFLAHHVGSGDATRTHDTPGMNACGAHNKRLCQAAFAIRKAFHHL